MTVRGIKHFKQLARGKTISYGSESKVLSLSDRKTSIHTEQEEMNETAGKSQVLAKPLELTKRSVSKQKQRQVSNIQHSRPINCFLEWQFDVYM